MSNGHGAAGTGTGRDLCRCLHARREHIDGSGRCQHLNNDRAVALGAPAGWCACESFEDRKGSER